MSEPSAGFAVGETTAYERVDSGQESRRKRAVIIVHGMGQQATFETVSSVAEIFAGHAPQAQKVVRDVQIDKDRLSRIELTFPEVDGPAEEVHFYEAYWAPLTEGRLTLRDVARFLVRAGLGGLRSSLRRTFPRWAFGSERRFPVEHWTWLALLLALVVVGALVTMNAAVAAVGGFSVFGPKAGWPPENAFTALNAIAGAVAVLILSFFATLNSASRMRRAAVAPRFRSMFSLGGWLHALLILIGMIAAALAMIATLSSDPLGMRPIVTRLEVGAGNVLSLTLGTILLIAFSAVLRRNWLLVVCMYVTMGWSLFVVWELGVILFGGSPFIGPLTVSGLRWGWWFLLGATVVVRQVLVQYLGDVAAYVSPQSLDKFNDLREEIKACVFKVGDAVYRAGRNGLVEYEQITVVGHSLGSVAAYDMLNRLLRDDAAGGGKLDVARRTSAFVTFGSPLDKIAFLFGVTHGDSAARALSATVQPLIQSGVRRFPWINIHSPNDPVSGKLDYFDVGGAHAVQNVVDGEATTPLVAHIEYWTGDCLRDALFRYVLPGRELKAVPAPFPLGSRAEVRP